MSIYYLNTDAPTDGDGSELNPYNNIDSALSGKFDGSLILFEGVSETVLSYSSSAAYNNEMTISPKDGVSRLKWRLLPSSSAAAIATYSGVRENVDMIFDGSSAMPSNFYVVNSDGTDSPTVFVNCSFKFENLTSSSSNLTMMTINSSTLFENCSFDSNSTNVAPCKLQSNSYSFSYFRNCTFQNFLETLSGRSVKYLDIDNPGASFDRCKFYNLKSYQSFDTLIYIKDSAAQGTIINCSFYECYAQQGVISRQGSTNKDLTKTIIHSNIFENTIDDPPYNKAIGAYAIDTYIEGVNVGNNIFVNTVTLNYTPSISLSDITTTNSQFSNVDPNSPLFLSLLPTAEAINFSPYINIDAGAMQSAGGGGGAGETDPDKVLNTSLLVSGNYIPVSSPSDVRLGVSFGLSETGTLNINTEANLPVESNVLTGITYGESLEFTGSHVEADQPAESDVRSGVIYNNTTNTGTLNINTEANLPVESNVLTGITYGESLEFTGTHTEADQPAESDVRSGVIYNNTTNTGTLDLPVESDVRGAVSYDNATKTGTIDINAEANLPTEAQVLDSITYGESLEFTGSHVEADQPAESDVRLGVIYNNTTNTGTLDLPTESDVRALITYDNATKTGLIDLPAESDVRGAVSYDNATKTGAIDINDEANLPLEFQVLNNIAYGENNDFIGSHVEADQPAESDVRSGIIYNNTTNTGTLNINVEANLPTEAQVLDSVTYGENLEFTGNHTEADMPAESDVRLGVTYNESINTGTLDLPSESDVRAGVSYDNATKTGLVDLPIENNVKDGITYDNNSKTGNVVLPADTDVRLGVAYDSNNSQTGSLNIVADYPTESDVRSGVLYDSGLRIGTLGDINTDNLDIQSVIKENIKTLIKTTLPDFKEMLYQVDPTKNDFFNNALQYAVLIEESTQTNALIYNETVSFTVRIKLTNDYVNHDDDLSARDSAKALITAYENIRRKIRKTRAGTYNKGITDITDFNRESAQYIDSSNIVVMEATFSIEYKVKNS